MDKKVGRNDPCPCGSGKKYKNCCAGKESKKTYTPEGKRKFKARVLSLGDTRSQAVFQGSAPQGSVEGGSMEALKFRFAQSDYRVKSEETKEEKLPFSIAKESETPTGAGQPFVPPSLPEEEFHPAEEDFRAKKEKKKE